MHAAAAQAASQAFAETSQHAPIGRSSRSAARPYTAGGGIEAFTQANADAGGVEQRHVVVETDGCKQALKTR